MMAKAIINEGNDTMNAIATISAKLNEVFADLDAEVLADTHVWVKGRKEAIANFKANNSARALGQHEYYERLFAVAGGKTWYNAIDGRSEAGVAEFVEKNHVAVITKRNASIAAKLTKAEVTEVVESTFARTKDGFDGTFIVETNKGRKVVTINTIVAGGYNIQCRHLRILIKVK